MTVQDARTLQCPWCAHVLDDPVRGFPCGCGNCLNVWDIPSDEPWEPQRVSAAPDLQHISRSDPRAAAVFKGVYSCIRSVSVIPEVPQRAIGLLHDPLVDIGEIADLIREDAVLTLGTLRLANSVAYGARQTTQDLKAACTRLGVKGIAKLMWTALNASLYRKGLAPFRTQLVRLWKHSTAVAECAELLVEATNVPEDHLVYVGALLHDVGKVVLLQAVCNLPARAVSAFARSPRDTENLLRTYHAPLGLHAVQYMKAPPEVRTITLHHHSVEMVTDPRVAQFTRLVACANALAGEAGYDAYATEGQSAADTSERTCLLNLGLKENAMQEIREAIPERVEGILSTFAVE